MISTFVTMITANQNVFLKVPDLFCIYRDPNKLELPKALMWDVPYFLEIQYSDNEYPNERTAYSVSGFDYSTKKMILDEKNKHVVEKDWLRAEFLANRRREIEYLLLPFADVYAFSYPPVKGWFLELDRKELPPPNRYGSMGYFYDKGAKEPETLYTMEHEKHFGNPQVLFVEDIRTNETTHRISMVDMFRFYYSTKSEIRRAVFDAAKQLHKSEGLSNIDSTAKFLYQIYALETLIEIENRETEVETCKECGQKTFSVRQKFLAFLQKYWSAYNKKQADEIYSLRSAMVHTGKSVSRSSFFTFEDQINEAKSYYIEEQTINITRSLTREVINKFLFLNSIPTQGKTQQENLLDEV